MFLTATKTKIVVVFGSVTGFWEVTLVEFTKTKRQYLYSVSDYKHQTNLCELNFVFGWVAMFYKQGIYRNYNSKLKGQNITFKLNTCK